MKACSPSTSTKYMGIIEKHEVKTMAYSNVQLSAPFSGFSVGCCINKVKVICYQLEVGK